jgi:hypothetical protein
VSPWTNPNGPITQRNGLACHHHSVIKQEIPMKVFCTAVGAAAVLAGVAAISLSHLQKTVAQAYATSAERFDQDESVNFFGR